MLSKCANPACAAKFRYLHTGKLFVARYRSRAIENGAASAHDFARLEEQWRCFWLCSDCSRRMTIQASTAGGVRIAPASNKPTEGDCASMNPDTLIAAWNPEGKFGKLDLQRKLDFLIKELEFLNSGGYRTELGWRAPLVFEDSPICPKDPRSSCPDPRCVLMGFVPERHKNQCVPCRHIPLNEAGENLQSLYHTASVEEIENTVREWLQTEIAELKNAIASVTLPGEAAA